MSKYSIFILLLQLFSAVFSSKLDQNGLTSRIVGGRLAPKYEYPFMVYFVAGPRNRLCGGALISKKHVITADHCLRTSRPDKYAFVIVGEHRVAEEDAFGPAPGTVFGNSMIRIKRFIRYTRRWDSKDIAILELVRELEFTDRVQPACIAGKDSGSYAGWTAVVAGWGGTVGYEPESWRGIDQRGSNILKETSLKVLQPDSKLCIKAIGDRDDMFCTYSSGTDSCQGDSGGPVFVRQNDKHVLIGVISRGEGCAAKGHAGGNVRISYLVKWIRDNVGDVCTIGAEDKPTEITDAAVATATTTNVISQIYQSISTTTTTTTTRRTTTTEGTPWWHLQQEELGCSCSNYINTNGFGRCRKSDSDFGGSPSCYVNLPSTCRDLIRSSTNPRKYLSAQACRNGF